MDVRQCVIFLLFTHHFWHLIWHQSRGTDSVLVVTRVSGDECGRLSARPPLRSVSKRQQVAALQCYASGSNSNLAVVMEKYHTIDKVALVSVGLAQGWPQLATVHWSLSLWVLPPASHCPLSDPSTCPLTRSSQYGQHCLTRGQSGCVHSVVWIILRGCPPWIRPTGTGPVD